ncbi:MAG: hypothetical protein FRX48_02047 [Lasallia pustulata]|uniref:Uncharacterized protein n=1 Tax=Lasallia pustulata TaxID=136370 RepID=A0A5M8PX89_9LECA|nr:MAG: hypothetical protein FRX48_02047 [Lasallia pustulata]
MNTTDMQSRMQDRMSSNLPPEYEALVEESTGEPPLNIDNLTSLAREQLYDKRMKEFKEFISARQAELYEQVWNVAHMDLLDPTTYQTQPSQIASTIVDESWKLPKYWIVRMNNEMLAVWATVFKEQPHSMKRLGELVRQLLNTVVMNYSCHWLNWAVSFGSLELSERAIEAPKNDVELLERMRMFQAAVGKALADPIDSYGEEPVCSVT